MKAFIFSICVLALLITAILINTLYVARVTSSMQEKLQVLPPCAQAREYAKDLLAFWKSKEKILELSVSATDISEVSERLTIIYAATSPLDEKAFEQARALCLDDIERIRDLERFTFLHIL